MSHYGDLIKRHEYLAFMKITTTTTSGGTTTTTSTYHRMTKFTQLSQQKNAQTYERQYVDEEFKREDVVGYKPTIPYNFDYHYLNPVHTKIKTITDGELTGSDALVEILLVDTIDGKGWNREYSIVPDTEGDNVNAYTYAGSFVAHGPLQEGTASTSDDWLHATFTEAT